jgi:hypothetical protein
MYAAGQVNGQMIPAYRETPHVDPNTATKLMWRSSSHGRHLALDRRAHSWRHLKVCSPDNDFMDIKGTKV